MQHTTVKPLGDRVLVKIKDAEEKTAGGILLPANAQGKPQGGEVVAVGEGKSVGKCKVDVSVKVMLLCWQIIDASIYSRFYFSRFWGRRLGGGGVCVFLLIVNLCDAVVCTDRCTSCAFKVCRD